MMGEMKKQTMKITELFFGKKNFQQTNSGVKNICDFSLRKRFICTSLSELLSALFVDNKQPSNEMPFDEQ